MTPPGWSEVSQLFNAALARIAEDRDAFLAEACGGDEALRREIESLLANTDEASAVLARLAQAPEGHLSAAQPPAASHYPRPNFTGTPRFGLRRCLGQGGFGTVYEVLDRQHGATVALKLLHAAADPAALYRFKREFRTLADLVHPNLVALDELFSEGDDWFFTMELVQGQPIVDFVRDGPPAAFAAVHEISQAQTTDSHAPLPDAGPALTQPGAVDEARLRDAFAQLVDGLSAIHQQGIVHRDIKPSNVLVTPAGRVVVLDFGIATQLSSDATSPTMMAGTPAYMAPEQALGRAVLPASDWYSVGVMLYEALTGRKPFTGTSLEVLLAKLNAPGLPHSLPVSADLLDLGMALLNPDAAKRPSGSEILRRLNKERPPVVVTAATAVARGPALIGRDAHLRALMSAFDAASAGQSVVVFMPGASGVGKTALMRRFLNRLRQDSNAVVLAGRCHERESVPYKAVDGLVDGLMRYLQRLPPIEAARRLPREASLIARLFPVLLRVAEVESARTRVIPPLEAPELRRRAATALRELLARISDRTPLVLAIDDLQWGDLDSGSLLQEIVRLPDPPPVLLLMAYRSEDSHAPLVRSLRDSLMADAARRDVRTLHVNELAPDEADELARRELANRPDIPAERSAEIARESRGNSFYIHELVHHTLTVGGPVHLNSVIRERVAALPPGAQQLLAAVALSAQPVTLTVAAAAAHIDRDPGDALRTLRAARLVRIHESAGAQELEPYHDRIRETITEGLDAASARTWHAQLAGVWEASGLARPETLVTHFRGAGDVAGTRKYAALAAATASEALAFQRAAQYYRLLLEVDEPAQASRWQTHLGDALGHAGRGREAAAAYLEALHDARPEMAIELERRAAEQLIRAGYLDQAAKVLDSLLPRIGVRPPRTEAGAFAGLVVRRFALALRGTDFHERPEGDIPLDQLRRIDVLWSIGAPLSLVELARGNNLHLRGAHRALRAGEPKRVLRAITTLACTSAIAGSHRDTRTARILEQAKQLAARIGDPTSIAHTVLAEAMCHKVVGRWGLAREQLERAIEQLTPCPGVRWEIETARTLLHDTLFWTGEWKRLFAEMPARRQEAEACGDLYSATHVAVRLAAIARLAADEPDRARAEAITAMARWPSGRFDLQHRWEVCSLIEADLYTGRAQDAWNRLRAAWPRLRWTIHAFQNARIEMLFFRARVALARAAGGERSYLRKAAGDAARLEREETAWATALAALVRASITATQGERAAALSQLDAAERALGEAGMAHYAAAAQFRRGQLLGGSEGDALLAKATMFFKEQNVVSVERIIYLLGPGVWPRSR